MRTRKRVLGQGAHWSNLANTTELSVFGGDPAFCQIEQLHFHQQLIEKGEKKKQN